MGFFQSVMNAPDIAVGVVLLIGILGGARRGLSGEIARLVTIVIAVFVAWRFSDPAADWVAGRMEWPKADAAPVAFVGVLFLCYTALTLVRHALRVFLDFSFKGKLELLGGALFGLVRALVFCVAGLMCAALIPSAPIQQAMSESRSGSAVINHLVPLYANWSEDNPRFKLPDLQQVEDKAEEAMPAETPPWDDYLGPLIDEEALPADEGGQP